MRVTVNGAPKEVSGCTLSEILAECGYLHPHIATALNEKFIHQHLRDQTVVKPGDRIEVVAPNAGG